MCQLHIATSFGMISKEDTITKWFWITHTAFDPVKNIYNLTASSYLLSNNVFGAKTTSRPQSQAMKTHATSKQEATW